MPKPNDGEDTFGYAFAKFIQDACESLMKAKGLEPFQVSDEYVVKAELDGEVVGTVGPGDDLVLNNETKRRKVRLNRGCLINSDKLMKHNFERSPYTSAVPEGTSWRTICLTYFYPGGSMLNPYERGLKPLEGNHIPFDAAQVQTANLRWKPVLVEGRWFTGKRCVFGLQ